MDETVNCKQSQNMSKLRTTIKINNGRSEDIHYPFFYKDLPDEFKTYAERELNETEEKKSEGIRMLKDIMKRENITDVDDRTMMFILRTCKYDFSKAEARLMKFHKSFRKMLRSVVEMDQEVIDVIVNEDVFGFLPYRDKHGRPIVFSKHSSNPVITNNISDVLNFAMTMSFLLCKYSPLTSVAGIASIPCHKDVPLLHYYELIKVLRNYYGLWTCLPVRIRTVDVIDEHPFTRFFYKIIRPFTSAKYNERVCFHGSNYETLHQFYHPDILPEEFGGNLGPISQISFREEMLNIVKILKDNPDKYT